MNVATFVIKPNKLDSFPISFSRAKRSFFLRDSDWWRRYHTHSLSGCHYFLCIVDDHSRAVWMFLLKDKSKTYGRLVHFCSMVQNQFEWTVQRVHSNNGAEFTNGPLQIIFLSRVQFMNFLC